MPSTTERPGISWHGSSSWSRHSGKSCGEVVAATETQDLDIGDSRDGYGNTRDWTGVEGCKHKCAGHLECGGFNYDFSLNMCTYKSAAAASQLVPSSRQTCFVVTRHTTTTLSLKDLLSGKGQGGAVVVHGRNLRGVNEPHLE